MGKKDVALKNYTANPEIFADLFNGCLFGGKQVVRPECFMERSPEIFDEKGGGGTVPDNIRQLKDGAVLALLALENQKPVDYHMVLRNMRTEALAYHRQWLERKKQHEKARDLTAGNEFISRIKRDDKFTPVVMLVVYYGRKPWDGPRHLHELLDLSGENEVLLPFIPDYRLNLFDYHDYEDFAAFQSDLRVVFEILRYGDDKKELMKKVAEKPRDWYNVSDESYEIITSLTHAKGLFRNKTKMKEDETMVNMAKAFEELVDEGVIIGEARGITKGERDKTKAVVRNMLLRKMPEEDICSLAECTREFLQEVKKEMEQ